MRASVSAFQAILLLVISASIITVAVPWALSTVSLSFDVTEINTIKSQFDSCNDRILETARTGSTNKCMFDVKNGQITGRTEGLYYKIVSSGPVCDYSPLVEIDGRTHVWQECNVTGTQRVYGMLWMFPKDVNITGAGLGGAVSDGSSVGFGSTVTFRTLTLSVIFNHKVGEAGTVVEMSRVNMTGSNVTLSVKIY